MTTKLKAILLVLVTFLLGALVGALVNGAITSKKSEALRARPPGPLFADLVERIVKPNEDQRKAIKDVLERHSERVTAEMESFRERMGEIVDSLKSELNPLLSPEQRERLTESLQRPFARRVFDIAGEPIEILREKLELNDRQVVDIKKIYDDVDHEMQTMSEDDRQDPMTRRQKFLDLERRVQEKIKGVLSPEQQKRYKEMGEFPPFRIFGRGSIPFGFGDEGRQPPRDSVRNR